MQDQPTIADYDRLIEYYSRPDNQGVGSRGILDALHYRRAELLETRWSRIVRWVRSWLA